MFERIVDKLTSGKFVFTVVCAALLYHGAVKGLFPADQTLSIIKDVVIFYFVVKQTIKGGKDV